MLLLLLILSSLPIYGIDQHQIYLYTGVGYQQQKLDVKENIYDTPSIGTGIGYRWNKFLSKDSMHYFSIGVNLGGGMIFPKLRKDQFILKYNSFLEFELFTGYGVGLGKYKQHQISIIGINFLPKFYGLLEKNNFTQIGGTEIEWYKGFYIPISVGFYLPSYRYVHNRFFIGFQHSINVLVHGNQNLNAPKRNLILSSFGYQFKLEIGLNYDNFSSFSTRKGLEETTIFIETNRNTVLISLFAKIEKENAEYVTIEVFALNEQKEQSDTQNLIAYASKIPVYNGQSQFTKHWKENKNFFEEKMTTQKDKLYFVIKEFSKENKLLTTRYINKNLIEKRNEEN
ncbi:MAG: hypothetical protein ACRCTQ_06985 [Brevinemataceae bacterium]